ncbi:MAG: AEC family transporter [Phycisphaerae bacterium]
MDYLEQIADIAYTVVAPIVVLAGAGYLVGRRVEAAADVLAKTLLYLLIPAFVFRNILDSDLGGAEYGRIIAFSAAALAALYVLAQVASRLRGHDRPLRGAFTNSVILYNSANFGIPVMALTFSFAAEEQTYAVAVQIIVAACQGTAAYTVGALIAAAGSEGVGRAMKQVLRLPFIYALAAALAMKAAGLGADVLRGVPLVWKPLSIISDAYVAMALLTLGAQIARVRLVRVPLDLVMSAGLRLVAGPLVGLGLVALLGLEGLLAQVLVIGVSGPSAVASAVVAIEFENRADFAAKAVMLSTLAAAVTVPVVIFAAQRLF